MPAKLGREWKKGWGGAGWAGPDVLSVGLRRPRMLVTMLGGNGLCGMCRRRTPLGYLSDAEPLAASLLCGDGGALAAECRIRRRGGAGYSGSRRRDPAITELANSR